MSISDIAQDEALQRRIGNLKQILDEKTQQLSSGKKASSYAELGAQAEQVLDIRNQLKALAGRELNGNLASTRMKVAQQALGRLEEAAANTGQDALTNNDDALKPLNATSMSRLSQAVGFLNTKADEGYVFAGRDNNTAPVPPSQVLMEGQDGKMGFKEVVQERLGADDLRRQGNADGTGHIQVTKTGDETVELSDRSRRLGFALVGIDAEGAGLRVEPKQEFDKPAASSPPVPEDGIQAQRIAFDGQPNAGDRVRVELKLPDGQKEAVVLKAVGEKQQDMTGKFLIGGDATQTAKNFRDKLEAEIGRLAGSAKMEAASQREAGNNFFDNVPPALVQRSEQRQTDAIFIGEKIAANDSPTGPSNIKAGDRYEIQIDDKTFSYVADETDTVDDVRTALTELVNSGSVTTAGIDGYGEATAGAATGFQAAKLDVSLATAAAPGTAEQWDATIPGSVSAGKTYTLDVAGKTYSYTANAADVAAPDSRASVAANLKEQIPDIVRDEKAGISLKVETVDTTGGPGQETLRFTGQTDNVDFRVDSAVTVTANNPGTEHRIDARVDGVTEPKSRIIREATPNRSQAQEFTLGSYVNEGDVFHVEAENPSGGNYTTRYEVKAGDTVQDVVEGLRDAINPGPPPSPPAPPPVQLGGNYSAKVTGTNKLVLENGTNGFAFDAQITVDRDNTDPRYGPNASRDIDTKQLKQAKAPELAFDDPEKPKAVHWYRGDQDTEPVRRSAIADARAGEPIDYGVRADEPPLTETIKHHAVLAARDIGDFQRGQLTRVDFSGPGPQGPEDKRFSVSVGDTTVSYRAEASESLADARAGLVDKLRNTEAVARDFTVAKGDAQGSLILAGKENQDVEIKANVERVGDQPNSAPTQTTVTAPAPSTAQQDEITINGSVDPGDTWEVKVGGPSQTKTVSYTAEAGDTVADVAQALASDVSGHSDVSATQLGPPNDDTLRITADAPGEDGAFTASADVTNANPGNPFNESRVETLVQAREGARAYREMANESGRDLRDASEELRVTKSELGLNQKQLKDAQELNTQMKKQLRTQLGEIENITKAEAASELFQIQTQLQMSYQITSRLSNLNLTNFL